ncbi:hypothetical protein V8F06_008488 [Rhypophila decipiens]
MMKQGEANVPGTLSLQARLGIRNHWDRADSVVKDHFFKLETVLGHKVVSNPEWPLLLAELHGLFPDGREQVANIAETVQVWVKSMLDLLDPEDAWADKVLEKTANSAGQLRLFLDVSAKLDKPVTSWSEGQQGFVITLPRNVRVQPNELFPVFRGQLYACFDEKKQTVQADKADDWADVEVDTTTGTPMVIDQQTSTSTSIQAAGSSTPQASPYLPTVASLSRPDELLSKPPYHLLLRQSARGFIEIQCSHSPSLQLLAYYFRKWCRVNHQDTRNPPAITVTLHQCAFALGEMFDRLTLSVHDIRYVDRFQPTVPMILVMIERVLGFKAVSSQSQGDVWHFRRDTEIVKTVL